MEEVGKIWPHVFKDRGFGARAPVLLVLIPLWPRVVGKVVARETRPVAFCDGALTVAAASECWVIQLRNMSEQVRCQINGFLGGPVVKKLRIRRHASWDAQASAAPAKDKPRLPDTAATDLWAQSGVKLEGDLAGIVERSFVKYFSRDGKDTKRCC